MSIISQEQAGETRKFDRQAYQAKRSAYIIAEVGLTADEAGDFIPLDNEFKQKMYEVGRECRKLNRESRSKESMSDEAYQKLIDCNRETRIKEAEIEKEYYEKFKKILPSEKLYRYQQADSKFTREFVKGRNHRNTHNKSD